MTAARKRILRRSLLVYGDMNRAALTAIFALVSAIGLFFLSAGDRVNEDSHRGIAKLPRMEADSQTVIPGVPLPSLREESTGRVSATNRTAEEPMPWRRSQAERAVERGEDPPGFGLLRIEALRHGVDVTDISVQLRGTADSIHAPSEKGHWSYFVRTGSHVLIDVTDETTGWVQTETTLAPDSGEDRTLVVELHPPQIDGEMLLRLVSSADGSPVAKAQVISVCSDPPDLKDGESDASGRVRVPRGPGFRYVVTAPGFTGLELPAFPPTALAFQTLELQAVAQLYGSVDPDLHGRGSIEVSQPVVDPGGSGVTSRRAITSAGIGTGGRWRTGDLTLPNGVEAWTGLHVDLVASGVRRSLARGLTVAPGDRIEVLDRFTSAAPGVLEFTYASGHALAKDVKVMLRRNSGTIPTESRTWSGWKAH
ncbi:hypothetical protein Poly30_03460 [Planctomycetes bacterium Poly30]|uniref:Uncharacterized protein n=2 Tax=Saltatorellus ferox TaxID=2528018 RepID=A0A518ELA0_9BACT|nr:hypothetical protein Poly30_03460 [Planctomycetes bacterium Poly30]